MTDEQQIDPLKPCRMCDKDEAFMDRHANYFAAECPRCHYFTEACLTEEKAITAWNARTTPAPITTEQSSEIAAMLEAAAQLVEQRFAMLPTLTLEAATAVAIALPDAIRALTQGKPYV